MGLQSDVVLDGRSLLAKGPSGQEPRVLAQQTAWTERAVGWSLIYEDDHLIDLERAYDAENGRRALFDLARDPGEQHDLAEHQPDRVADMRAALDDRLAALARESPLQPDENVLSEMDRARLRALGYVE